ncbi:putative DNA topoisomerase III alpha [Ochromonadaceae sp. CCMP2298]|nr:putative DNA topoisomerase III alpha [Ochromonadaceae sp. CCMP2298]
MAKILSVAEKPSVAKELASIISRQPADSIKRPGFSPYNPIFEINHCLFKNQPAKMTMTSVTGHLMEIEFNGAYKGWTSCQPLDLFTAPLEKSVKKEGVNIEKTLAQEARRCNVLLLWLDCDLEGENIAYEVISVCIAANPHLDVYRARFSALIERDIMRTMRVPDRPNPHMNDAVEARQEIDLRIGAAFTRFQTLRLQKRFENLGNSVISFGPCQFPTLGFVVERSMRIKAFRPEDFWYITLDLDFVDPDKPSSSLNCSFHWDRGRLYDQLSCFLLYEMCIEEAIATVTHCHQRPTSRQKPVPLNTIEYQIRASRLLRMSSDKAMQVAEALYQRGVLSYPRTETNFFQEGIELQQLVSDHRNHPDWGGFAAGLSDGGFQWPRNGGKDDQAHPPIHPTKCVALADLQSEDERRVYDLVARHFLASCSTDARGSQTKIGIRIGGEGFHATGLMVTARNWLEVYSYERWSGSKVPVVAVGDRFSPKRMFMAEGRTAPPECITEAELISTMDKNGIGTDATIATHISTIQAREYVVKNERNQFEPTKLGLALVEGYNSMGYQLNKPQLRAVIEQDCQKIAKGEAPRAETVKKCLVEMAKCFLTCTREAHLLDASMNKYFTGRGAGDATAYRVLQQGLSACGDCGGGMELRADADEEAAPEPRRRGAQVQVAEAGDGTSRYLYCRPCAKAHSLPSRGLLLPHEKSCPICNFQVLCEPLNPHLYR